jgi:hypothetical protein
MLYTFLESLLTKNVDFQRNCDTPWCYPLIAETTVGVMFYEHRRVRA